jgi:hypothetical protein
MSTRRQFVQWIPLAACGLAAATPSQAQATLVDEKSPQAVGLGYVADAAKADKAKYKQYAAGQNCSNCALYQGKAGAAAAGCPLFAGKQVTAKGWCSAYAKKG